MRVPSVAWLFDNLDDVMHVAELTAEVSHNHPEGIKGAQALASAAFLARKHTAKNDIRDFVEMKFGYDLTTSLNTIRAKYHFDMSCQGSVPQALCAFLESGGYENAVRLAVSIGGDSDTIACMTGAVAEAYYGIPEKIKEAGIACLDDFLKNRIISFQELINQKA